MRRCRLYCSKRQVGHADKAGLLQTVDQGPDRLEAESSIVAPDQGVGDVARALSPPPLFNSRYSP